ncbi:hypothetical protein RB628_14865 [Streptomyces sp. ADMS]|uniref:hypothetical protein n=1 Tax=Streptomyces sp. ADMS TaxID=3071415 RepID=UPI00296F5428|nr:hypothetical protein [Streptomyces sp. ADMS]MDW4906584.1 hypothetical protein [Streptomyces sp. ADMS]
MVARCVAACSAASAGLMSVGAGAGLRRTGSGIVSVDNGDPTGTELLWALRSSGLPYRESLHRNIVPWCLVSADRIAAPGQTETQRAVPFLHEVR